MQLDENVQNGESAIETALESGYRHIDTAYVYRTESIIGKTINNLISSGKFTREEIFLVTKVCSLMFLSLIYKEFIDFLLLMLQTDV